MLSRTIKYTSPVVEIKNILHLEFQGTQCLLNNEFSIVLSKRGERKQINIFSHLKWTNKPAKAKIMKFPDFSLTFLVSKISLTILQNSLTFH